jgi:hypothetical protein
LGIFNGFVNDFFDLPYLAAADRDVVRVEKLSAYPSLTRAPVSWQCLVLDDGAYASHNSILQETKPLLVLLALMRLETVPRTIQ